MTAPQDFNQQIITNLNLPDVQANPPLLLTPPILADAVSDAVSVAVAVTAPQDFNQQVVTHLTLPNVQANLAQLSGPAAARQSSRYYSGGPVVGAEAGRNAGQIMVWPGAVSALY